MQALSTSSSLLFRLLSGQKTFVFSSHFVFNCLPLGPSHSFPLTVKSPMFSSTYVYSSRIAIASSCRFYFHLSTLTIAYFINNPNRSRVLHYIRRTGVRPRLRSTTFRLPVCTHNAFNISTLKRKPYEEEDALTKQRNEAMLHMARLATSG